MNRMRVHSDTFSSSVYIAKISKKSEETRENVVAAAAAALLLVNE